MPYIGIDRGIVKHWIYEDAEYFKVWFEMLYRARFSTEPDTKLIDNILVDMHYGEFIYGRNKWSERLKITERRLRTLMDKLIKDGMIEVVNKYPRFTQYRIINYAKYNQQNDQQESQSGKGIPEGDDQHNDQRATSRRPADDQQTTTKEEGINNVNHDRKKDYTPAFESFWSIYPRKIGKQEAFGKWKTALKKHDADFIIQCATNYAKDCESKNTSSEYIKHARTFLEKERYTDYQFLVIGGGNDGKYRTGYEGNRLSGNQKESYLERQPVEQLYFGSPKKI